MINIKNINKKKKEEEIHHHPLLNQFQKNRNKKKIKKINKKT